MPRTTSTRRIWTRTSTRASCCSSPPPPPRNPNGGVNDYTGSDKPRTGIVQNTLQNGYPVLSQGDRSLAYLFNPNLANAGKASFPGVRNLLQIDDQSN
ncbi:hypothetical protein [uncultured Subdoligranulum sp.]|uniref:hypothetical protein n=1 Tax=uncultured Subdoligranulum sp. TaxID=512298 RepID=UPI003209C2E9